VHHSSKIEAFFVDTFLQLHPEPPEGIVLDVDATDNPLHGHQLGRFFHGYYQNYCYLPLDFPRSGWRVVGVLVAAATMLRPSMCYPV
jgi:hypothetical protein